MLSLPDTLWGLLAGVTSIVWTTGFRPPWPCQIIEVLVTQAKFLDPSDYCSIINCTFTFCTTNDFSCFHSIMAQFELVKHKFLNYITLCIHLCGFWITLKMKQYMTCQFSNYVYYQPERIPTSAWIASVTWYVYHKLVWTKMLPNFWLSLNACNLHFFNSYNNNLYIFI